MFQVLSVEETLTTQLISALEEDSKLARLLACRSLHSLLKLTTQRLNTDSLNKIYPGMLNSSHILENNERQETDLIQSSIFYVTDENEVGKIEV